MESQNKTILAHLRRNKSITSMAAIRDYEITRLAARIHDLKEAGHTINSERIKVPSGKYVARYTLIKEAGV